MSAPRLIIWISAVVAVLVTDTAFGQNYPTRPIRFLTTGLGGSTDLAARTVAQGLTDMLGWAVVVDNRGSTIVACDMVAKAAPDGYSILVITDGLWRGGFFQKMPFDPVKDFAPITLVSRSPNILVVHPALPVRSVKELIALAKAKPGELNYGAGAIGASTHLSSELFKVMAGVNIVHVPYKSTGGAVIPLISGQLQLMFGTTGTVMTHIKSGKLRALAISTAQPSALAPDLPTVAVAGNLPGFESAATAGIFGPAGLSPALVKRLNEDISRVLLRPEVKERFFNQAVDIVGGTPQETAAFVKSDMATTARIVKEAGIKVDR
ncbi:MAG TPA: tripartite tricarboxylate transporter substrate binding protein [Burkholderiales bacterium]|jgi:tripartite-type tricarboxylate transporter receptor subunit TctC|nr:tripartite tricarboxylate transporter substrate binding protein [Burkholderiales bacterium]